MPKTNSENSRAVPENWIDPGDFVALDALLTRHWARVDRLDESLVSALYTHDGIMKVGSLECVGRGQIDDYFAKRHKDEDESKRHTRHLTLNMRLEAVSDDAVTVCSTVVVFAGFGDMPLPATAPSTLADFEDRCVRTLTGEWLFSSRRGRVVFTGPGAGSHVR